VSSRILTPPKKVLTELLVKRKLYTIKQWFDTVKSSWAKNLLWADHRISSTENAGG